MWLTSLRDLLTAIATALVLAVGPALLAADGASALEPLRTVGLAGSLPASAVPSLLLGLGALVALGLYGRPRNDP
jgi:hypothetical protein